MTSSNTQVSFKEDWSHPQDEICGSPSSSSFVLVKNDKEETHKKASASAAAAPLSRQSMPLEDWEKQVLSTVYRQMEKTRDVLFVCGQNKLANFYSKRCVTLKSLWREMKVEESGESLAIYIQVYRDLLKSFPKTVKLLKKELKRSTEGVASFSLAKDIRGILGYADLKNPFGILNFSGKEKGWLATEMLNILNKRREVDIGEINGVPKPRRPTPQARALQSSLKPVFKLSSDRRPQVA